MANIKINKICNGIRSCNVCGARNYQSSMIHDNNIVDKLYTLSFKNLQICLCKSCIENLEVVVETFLNTLDVGGPSE